MAGEDGRDALVIAEHGKSQAVIIAAEADAKPAGDLAHYIKLMTGADVPIAKTPEAIAEAVRGKGPVLFVGEEAIKANGSLKAAMNKVAKKNPTLRADAIVVRRNGNKVYLAGTNAESHYHAVSHLLHAWGCRWYLPTEFGETIPEHATLKIGKIDFSYAPPFEVRHYWISWNGSGQGAADFRLRNYMVSTSVAGMGHALAKFTGDIAPEGKNHWNVPFAEDATAQHVANKLIKAFTAGESSVSLAIEDGAYSSASPVDAELIANVYDKYFLRTSATDPMMVFYINVAKLMTEKVPNSKTKIGGMAYVNVTIPPQRQIEVPESVVMWLAPIDIDPTHGMDDHRSPPRVEYREMLYRWADIMKGRVVIYDYDQGMLVWRDIPNPSHMAFRQDVKHYRAAGILGIGTESRNAIATVFTNLYFRGQLMWNPDADVDAMLAEFYPKFYGPAAAPMARYWGAIYKAWENTIATEHEFFVAPAVYTPAVMAQLTKDIAEAESLVKPLIAKGESASRNEKLYVERMQWQRHAFDTLRHYMAMVAAATSEVDYQTALIAGEAGLKSREAMTAMRGGIFTTTKAEGGYPWWPGEVKQYRELLPFTDGSKGKLITKLPLEWAFRRDPHDTGLPMGFAYKDADLTYWKANASKYQTPETRKDYPTTEWEVLRSDMYAQSQGVLHPDWQSFTGFMWYKTPVELKANDLKNDVHIKFPGLFSEAWLYVNGYLVAHRKQNHMWWYNDYRFEWDVDLTGKLKPGKNDITLRIHNTHHNGGLFRRPFLYQPTAVAAEAKK